MKNIITKGTRFLLLGSIVGLVACSSSDGGDGGFKNPNIPSAPVSITTDNEKDVAQAGFSGLSNNFSGASSSSSSSQSPAPVQSMSNLSTSSVDTVSARSKNKIFQRAKSVVSGGVQLSQNSTTSVSVTGVTVSDSYPCFESGSESFSATIADFNETTQEPNMLTAGDSITVSFNSCDEGYGEVTNGSVTVTINSNITLDEFNADTNLDITIRFINLSSVEADIGTYTMHGALNITASTDIGVSTFSMRGDSFFIIAPNENIHLTNFNFSVAENISTSETIVDATFTVASSAINGSITVGSQLVYASFATYPNDGYMNITGNNSELNIDIIDASTVVVTLTIDGVVQADYPKTTDWAGLEVEVGGITGADTPPANF